MIDFGSHVSTGLIGIQQLMRGLTENGRGDLALQIATNTTYPSWGYMVEHGATTIWELWNGDTADPAMNSGNHVMLLGDLVIWLYNYLGGIGQTPGSVAYKHVQLKPYLIAGIDSVRASYQSVYGPIVSRWKRAGTSFSWHFEIPANTSARICFPVSGLGDVEPLRRQFDGFHAVYQGMEGAYAVFEVPSGVYDAKL
jgi:alpha-L-rhamnosidase